MCVCVRACLCLRLHLCTGADRVQPPAPRQRQRREQRQRRGERRRLRLRRLVAKQVWRATKLTVEHTVKHTIERTVSANCCEPGIRHRTTHWACAALGARCVGVGAGCSSCVLCMGQWCNPRGLYLNITTHTHTWGFVSAWACPVCDFFVHRVPRCGQSQNQGPLEGRLTCPLCYQENRVVCLLRGCRFRVPPWSNC